MTASWDGYVQQTTARLHDALLLRRLHVLQPTLVPTVAYIDAVQMAGWLRELGHEASSEIPHVRLPMQSNNRTHRRHRAQRIAIACACSASMTTSDSVPIQTCAEPWPLPQPRSGLARAPLRSSGATLPHTASWRRPWHN